ncbi:MAG: GIY-YIG nuclease family protein [Nitrospira sp.]|nr:GIY-YIG nuclease family protein [Nitrospira sp.]
MAALPTLGSLKTAEEVAAAVRMSAGRLRELAEVDVVPHFRIDGGPPLFSLAGLKDYVRRHLVTVCPGEPLPINLRPVVQQPPAPATIPRALAEVEARLCEIPPLEYPPCVYFLVLKQEIVYVGQSRNLLSRLGQHREDGKCWDRVLYLPVPADRLLEVESLWIKTLQPALNRAGRQASLSNVLHRRRKCLDHSRQQEPG